MKVIDLIDHEKENMYVNKYINFLYFYYYYILESICIKQMIHFCNNCIFDLKRAFAN